MALPKTAWGDLLKAFAEKYGSTLSNQESLELKDYVDIGANLPPATAGLPKYSARVTDIIRE